MRPDIQMNILIIDTRTEFAENVMFAALSRISPNRYSTLDSAKDLSAVVRNKQIGKIVISQNVLEKEETDLNADFGAVTGVYCQDESGIAYCRKKKIRCYGILRLPEDVFDAVEGTTPRIPGDEQNVCNNRVGKKHETHEKHENYEEHDEGNERKTVSEIYEPIPHEQKEALKNKSAGSESKELQDAFKDPFADDITHGFSTVTAYGNAWDHLSDHDEEKNNHDKNTIAEPDFIDREIEKDFHPYGEGNGKIITVYSAKGGVGKTTIATELAEYLSLVKDGRQEMRVCLVDYNIDFGDVRGTLHIRTAKSLTTWAEDVREMIEKGRAEESIHYTKEEIEQYLETDTRTGLFFLPAPLNNEDSAIVNDTALNVILRCLKESGEFDYIICDTGNNTRDSTTIAIEYADIVLLLIDQNVNTANCDMAFLRVMEEAGYDVGPGKVKLVINRIMPAKSTSISVSDITETFDFELVGKISFSMDVIKATNDGVPLSYSAPDSEFTKQLRKIVSYILGRKEEEEMPRDKKEGLLARIFRRRKGA